MSFAAIVMKPTSSVLHLSTESSGSLCGQTGEGWTFYRVAATDRPSGYRLCRKCRGLLTRLNKIAKEVP